MKRMETVQIRFPKEQIREIDRIVKEGRYSSRSEAIRTMLKELGSIRETIEVLSDKALVKQIKQGMKEIEEGKGIPFESVKKEILG